MILIQLIAGLVTASFLEWTVHKYLLHKLGRKKKSVFSFHWVSHHAQTRRNRFIDTKISARETIGVLSLCVLALPIWFILPYMYYAMAAHAAVYLVLHTLAHTKPGFGKKWLPWHHDHHMGKNQNMNWCVVHPLADWIMGTRRKYEYGPKPNATRSSKKRQPTKKNDS